VGTGAKVVKLDDHEADFLPEDCQQICQDYPDVFAFTAYKKECSCLKKDDTLTRRVKKGASSGPIMCGEPDDSLEAREEAYERNQRETPPKVPVYEDEPCDEDHGGPGKSDPVSNYKSVEEKQQEWHKKCITKAAEVTAMEYNKFYKRMGKFLKSMAWQAGCGSESKVQWDHASASQVTQEFDAGSFSECDWDHEEEMDKKMVSWTADQERARGWTNTNRINMDEQKTVTMGYPMPAWLSELKSQLTCLKKTAAGKVANNQDARSTSVITMMESATMTEESMASASDVDHAFDNAVENAP